MDYIKVDGGPLVIGPRLSGLLDKIKAGEQVWQEGEDLRQILAKAVLDDVDDPKGQKLPKEDK